MQTTGVLVVAGAVLQGDQYQLLIGIIISPSTDLNQTVLLPHFIVSYYAGAGGTGPKSVTSIAAQPVGSSKQPFLSAWVSAEGQARVPPTSDPLLAQPG